MLLHCKAFLFMADYMLASFIIFSKAIDISYLFTLLYYKIITNLPKYHQ